MKKVKELLGMTESKPSSKKNEGINFRKLAKELAYDVDSEDTIKGFFDAIKTAPEYLASELGCEPEDVEEMIVDRLTSALGDEFGIAQDLEGLVPQEGESDE